MTESTDLMAALRTVFTLQAEGDQLTVDQRARAAYEQLLAEYQATTEGLGDNEEQLFAELAEYGDNIPAEVTEARLIAHYTRRVETLRPLATDPALVAAAGQITDLLATCQAELDRLTVADVHVISFGYGHQDGEHPPAATVVVDLRHHFRDPHVDPAMRQMTGHDLPVSRNVMQTAGITELLEATAAQVLAYRKGPNPGPVTVAFGCVGGRHRSVAASLALPSFIRAAGGEDLTVRVAHLHDGQPVIQR